MTKDVQTAGPDTPLYEIADLLEEHHIKRVPIVNDLVDIVGIVSRANIIQAVASARPQARDRRAGCNNQERLIAELKKQSWSHVHKLNATVANGVVDLWGFAQSEAERRAIRVAAEAIPGVIAVNDHLTREPLSLIEFLRDRAAAASRTSARNPVEAALWYRSDSAGSAQSPPALRRPGR